MRLTALLHRSLAGCAIAAALAVSAPAAATALTNTGWLSGSTGESYTIQGGAVTPIFNPVAAGGFTGTFGVTPITYWCFDLLHSFNLNSTADYVASALGGGIATQLSELYNVAAANGGFSDADHSAAFQLAIWNLEYEGDLSVSTGTFRVTGGAAAIGYANTWLGLLSNPIYANPAHAVIALNSTSNPQHQNFVTFTTIPDCCTKTVPEPPMLPLVLTVAGIASLIQTRRPWRVGGE